MIERSPKSGAGERAEIEDLKRQEDVRRALQQTTSTETSPPVPIETGHKLWLAGYGVALLLFGGAYYLVRLGIVSFAAGPEALALRVLRGAIAIVCVLAASKVLDAVFVSRLHDVVSRYNVRRILRFLAGLVLALIGVSMLFADWYTAFVSLGVISLVLGFSLQTPITSLIGWIYILAREPYRIGDRIKVGAATGDVIDVSYLDTTLWEFGGDYLSSDHPSGRVIKFPNATILNTPVYNYSWALFPYIWNEIKFNVAYESDLDFVAETMQKAAEEEIGEEMMERVRVYRELLAQTPVDGLNVRERPVVFFRVGENTWLEAIVRYLVHPREAGSVKTRLIRRLLERLRAEPERVMFPKSDAR